MIGASVATLGGTALRFVDVLGQLALFAGRIAGVCLRPPVRVQRFLEEIYKIGALSVSIVSVSGITVGMVLSLEGYRTLTRFGATGQLGAVVGYTLIRELGPVLAALLVTGRAASATTAEIGTMVTTEQLDGLRMMSVDPVDYVVMPKALAMLVAMPLLTALFTTLGIAGGYFVGVSLMGVDGGSYLSSLENKLDFDDVMIGVLKSLIFGCLVGVYCTWRGTTTKPTSAGVAAATTSTVVVGSVTVLVFDFFITALWGN